MKLQKYEHACFTIELNGEILVVDPGVFSSDFIAPEYVVAVVITHIHPDHLDTEHISSIVAKNPNAIIYGPAEVIDALALANKTAVTNGEVVTVGAFTLEFFGQAHHLIHPTLPLAQNVGVLINDLLYYPGDSFTLPDRTIDTLALPVAAPWLQIGEAIDFLLAVKPRLAFPTHDAIYSDVGKHLVDTMLSGIAEKNGIDYCRVQGELEL
jgi:L-ascorbate metabolism protein UlaG (beta-lactamase superfamily)